MSDGLLPRHALATAQRRAAIGRVLVVNGPRQSGKTSLLHLLGADMGGEYLSLDDARTLRPARTDPGGFVREATRPTFIDEVQRGGEPLVLAIKSEVDRHHAPGQFVLAGSTRFLFEPRLSESLAGRALFVDLWPFSQGEIGRRNPEDFVTALFGGPNRLRALDFKAESRRATFERVCRGGMPAALHLQGRDRREFLNGYLRSLATRDVAELGRLPASVDLRELMRVLAARTAQEHNVVPLAASLGVSVDVGRRLLGMLETVYFHHRVPAWSRNLTSKTVRKPKLHLVDSGVAAVLCGVDAERLRRPDETISGPLLETFVVGEIARQLTWSKTEASLYHWRDRDGPEVDVVLEAASGEIVGVEVKAALDFDLSDFAGLRTMRDRLGDRFVVGVLLHCGDRVQWVADRILAMPVASLWEC